MSNSIINPGIPAAFPSLVRELAQEILWHNPADVVGFAAAYFSSLAADGTCHLCGDTPYYQGKRFQQGEDTELQRVLKADKDKTAPVVEDEKATTATTTTATAAEEPSVAIEEEPVVAIDSETQQDAPDATVEAVQTTAQEAVTTKTKADTEAEEVPTDSTDADTEPTTIATVAAIADNKDEGRDSEAFTTAVSLASKAIYRDMSAELLDTLTSNAITQANATTDTKVPSSVSATEEEVEDAPAGSVAIEATETDRLLDKQRARDFGAQLSQGGVDKRTSGRILPQSTSHRSNMLSHGSVKL